MDGMPPIAWKRWAVVGALAVLASLGAGVFAAKHFAARSPDLEAVLTGGRRAPPYVAVASVGNSSGVGGPALQEAAQHGIEEALTQSPDVTTTAPPAAASRGARGAARGHWFDANIQSVQATGDRARVQVSIVVSSYPGRSYEFESSSTVTVTGAGSSPAALAQGVRAAMAAATRQAIAQMNQPSAF